MSPSVPSESLWQLDRLKFFNMTAQFQHGIERFRRRAVREAGGQVVPPLLKLVQQVNQGLHRISPLSRSTASICGPTVPDDRRRLRRRSRDGSLAPRPIGRGSLGGGRGAIATGWWPWHPRLISRDASRVQWIDMHHQVGGLAAVSAGQEWLAFVVIETTWHSFMNRGSTWVAGERSGQMRPYVRPVSWGSPLAIMGVRLRVRHQS
jgi:hypothetical protein